MRETGREKTRKTAVLIPCYNESQTIEKVIREFREALPEADIYVYDNNSTDGTGELRERQEPLCGRNTFRERET